ncbi:MAG: hypothetical protein Q7T55_26300, partial [Solirubrobacteraceae bacterium]|nr:hypothetical protein [Solirubrobacteraceae bacterium]
DNFFDSAFVLGSENAKQYNALNRTLKSELPQSTVMDKYNANRITNSMWHAQRARRLQTAVIESAGVKALKMLLKPKYWKVVDRPKRLRLAVLYFSSSEEDRRMATRRVERLGITRDMIEAKALELQGATVMILEKMQTRSEQSIEQAEKKLMKSTRSYTKNRSNKSERSLPSNREDDDSNVDSIRPRNDWN